MRIQCANQSNGGFTLVELVISSALMSIILMSAYLCLSSGIASQKLIESRADVVQSARVAMALIGADLRSACVLSRDYDFLGMDRMIGEVEADNLDFGTHHYSPKRPRESDFCEVSYFVEKDRKTGEFVLFRRRDATPDDQPLSGGEREEIARGLLGLRLEYYDGFEWFDEWGDPEGKRRGQQSTALDLTNLSGLPEAVRITLSLNPNPKIRPPQEENSEASSDSEEKPEPPLVFQTMVRLNLASVSQSSGSSSSPSTGTTSSPGGAGL